MEITWILIGAGIIFLIVYAFIPNKTAFLCPKCGKTFVPKKSQLMGTHTPGKCLLTCPYCGKMCMMGKAKKRK